MRLFATKKDNIEKYCILQRRGLKDQMEYCCTPVGDFSPDEWITKVRAAISADGLTDLYRRIQLYCLKKCSWLHTGTEVEEYAAEILTSGTYKYWSDFRG